MGDNYEELVELGFEGVDRFANRFHDTCFDFADKRVHKKNHSKGGEDDQARTSQRARSEPAEDWDRGHSRDREQTRDRNIPSQDDNDNMRRERPWRDDEMREDRHVARPNDRDIDDMAMVRARGTAAYPGDYQMLPSALVPPPAPYMYAPPPVPPYAYHGDNFTHDRRRPPPLRRRSSSYSPPRHYKPHRPPPLRERRRSKSPNHHRAAAALVGALAGGVIGNAVSSDKGNRWTTIAGAVVGGLGGRELEKAYDRRKDEEIEEEERRERRRRAREDYWAYS